MTSQFDFGDPCFHAWSPSKPPHLAIRQRISGVACLAYHIKLCSQIVPKKQPLIPPATACGKRPATPPAHRSPWADLLARVFGLDLKSCPRCGGQIKIIAAIFEPFATTSILSYLGLPDKPPALAPATIGAQAHFA